MTGERQYQLLLTDLIDILTIDQIKEVLLPVGSRATYVQEMQRLSHDIDGLLKEKRIKVTGWLVRLIILLAQANLHVWYNKDHMQNEPEKYYDLLECAQEWNGLRNYTRNLLSEEFGEAEPCNQRVTFLDYNSDRWYSTILEGMKKAGET